MDYRKLAGVHRLPAAITCGRNITIAILDSGVPTVKRLRRMVPDAEAGNDDRLGHATAIASILFGGRGITGLCERANPLYVKVLDDSGRGTIQSVANGIQTALKRGAEIINLSVGFARTEVCPKELEEACNAAERAHVPIICAAGNDSGAVNWPAALQSTISVGAAGTDGLKTSFSSRGEIDLIAPGENLTVLDVHNHLTTVSGTSFAAAIITGVSALVIADIKEQGHSDVICTDVLRRILYVCATDVGSEGWDELTGYGLIAGKKYLDRTVGQMIQRGFFDKIKENIRGLLGLGRKEKQHGSRV